MYKRYKRLKRHGGQRGLFATYILGFGLVGLSLMALIFVVYALLAGEQARGFLLLALFSGLFGAPLLLIGTSDYDPSRREALTGVIALWLAVPLFGILPYIVSGHMTPLNAFFESMSGFTTTGATVLEDFDTFTQSLFMWRAFTQWVGGVGIIVLFIAVFPQLAIAGRQLFFAEAPGPTEERLTPRLRHTSNAVLIVYVGLTVVCITAYIVTGMDAYNAIAHAFTTISAGGFSPNPLSFAPFSAAQQWVCIGFMFLAGVNFALQYRLLMGRPADLLNNTEFRGYSLITVVATLILSGALLGVFEGEWLTTLRHGFFQTLSILTSTGYASDDFNQWPNRALSVIIVLMFIGGSAGSAAGGIKVVRWMMIVQNVKREVRRALHPRAVILIRLNNRGVSDEVMRGVAAFVTLFIGLFALTTTLLVWLEPDISFTTAFTATIACIGNVGPGLGAVGPMANFADLTPPSRLLLIFGMFAGRLEIITIFILFVPTFWHLPRRRGTSI